MMNPTGITSCQLGLGNQAIALARYSYRLVDTLRVYRPMLLRKIEKWLESFKIKI